MKHQYIHHFTSENRYYPVFIQGGFYLFKLMDDYGAGYPLPCIALTELFAISWVYRKHFQLISLIASIWIWGPFFLCSIHKFWIWFETNDGEETKQVLEGVLGCDFPCYHPGEPETSHAISMINVHINITPCLTPPPVILSTGCDHHKGHWSDPIVIRWRSIPCGGSGAGLVGHGIPCSGHLWLHGLLFMHKWMGWGE